MHCRRNVRNVRERTVQSLPMGDRQSGRSAGYGIHARQINEPSVMRAQSVIGIWALEAGRP